MIKRELPVKEYTITMKNGEQIKKDNTPLSFIDGTYLNQDKKLCDYFQVNYQQVNSIELI